MAVPSRVTSVSSRTAGAFHGRNTLTPNTLESGPRYRLARLLLGHARVRGLPGLEIKQWRRGSPCNAARAWRRRPTPSAAGSSPGCPLSRSSAALVEGEPAPAAAPAKRRVGSGAAVTVAEDLRACHRSCGFEEGGIVLTTKPRLVRWGRWVMSLVLAVVPVSAMGAQFTLTWTD